MYFPGDFAKRLLAVQRDPQAPAAAQWIVDGGDPTLSRAIRSLQSYRAEKQASVFEFVLYYNPEGRSAIHIVPGLVAVVLTMTMVMFTSTAIVREREQGNMEFLITTPLHPVELMLGKIVPSILMSGFLFPFSAMPMLAQWIAELLPATHYVRLIRAVVLRDAQWIEPGTDLFALLA